MKLTAMPGSIVNVRVAFKDPDANNAAYDPPTVSIRLKRPDSTVSTFTYGTDVEVVKESAGHYLFRLSLALEGTYRWVWTGASPIKAVAIPGLCDSVQTVDF